ncbi:shikimate dehydrogenase [Halomonas sp. HNIBRBA4712]|uniref:shikimate dehydrogenase n=1 Tax=Halomonas sp. HNIBRBA4712 TaxID=3373087 RepID=UPI003744E99F
MSERYCVLGNPVAHSKSPLIHQAFAAQTGQLLEYTAELAPLDGFEAAWRAFCESGGRGANVTVPFKQEAFALCDTLSERARRAGAVNTLINGQNGRIYGDNTDGIGLLRDLTAHDVALAGKRVLVLGAGGAVRGALAPLLAERPDELLIINRTGAKAEALARDFADVGAVRGGSYDALEGTFDLVINATSASLSGELPPLPEGLFTPGGVAYDMMYGVEPTVFLQWAKTQKAATVDGLGMLVEQAAEAFFLWRNVRPETVPVRALLRETLTR